jgi:hypothetical protein
VKPSVQEATAAALPACTYSNGTAGVGATLTANANAALVVDGITASAGDRVLAKDEATASHNGIYLVTATGSGSAPWVVTRAPDLNSSAQVPGAFCFVEQGTVNAGAGFTVASPGPFTVGTTAITFTQFSGAGEVTAGSGLAKTGNQLSLASPVTVPVAPAGLAGATAASRYAGATASGAPASGTFAVGDFVLDQTGTIWVCTTAGTPGTWTFMVPASGAAMTGFLAPKVVVLSDAATIAVNAKLGNDFRVTIAGNRTAGAPANPADGEKITFEVIQDSTGSRTLTWTSGAGGYSFGSGSAPTLSTAAGAADQVAFRYSATKLAWCYLGSTGGF